MPSNLTFPGVYIEEIPSGVRTIIGVATSITAFIGRALRGPTDEPVVINSFGDFEREFGGLWVDSSLGYAVRDFYLNGGSQAIIVRLHNSATAARITTSNANPLTLDAASRGKWGENLRIEVDHKTKNPSDKKMFNLTVYETTKKVTAVSVSPEEIVSVEKILNVSVDKNDPRFVRTAVNEESRLVRIPEGTTLPGGAPAEGHAEVTIPPTDGVGIRINEFIIGKEVSKEGLYALEKADLFNLLCIPPYKDGNVEYSTLIDTVARYCEKKRAMLIVDPPSSWKTKGDVTTAMKDIPQNVGTNSKNAALFFPRLRQPNQLRDNKLEDFAPCGAVAGIFARTDTQRGVWKAPAGFDASLIGVPQLTVPLTNPENGELNQIGVNCLRNMPAAGNVVWGSRTLQGNDRLTSEWKYIPVRRTALFLEESLYRALQWVVFEPNDEPLWSQIRLNVGAFLNTLFRQGAFQGSTPREAYFVKCDKETTTQNDIDRGVVNILVGFAPLKPAEFVVIKLQQIAGQIQV